MQKVVLARNAVYCCCRRPRWRVALKISDANKTRNPVNSVSRQAISHVDFLSYPFAGVACSWHQRYKLNLRRNQFRRRKFTPAHAYSFPFAVERMRNAIGSMWLVFRCRTPVHFFMPALFITDRNTFFRFAMIAPWHWRHEDIATGLKSTQ